MFTLSVTSGGESYDYSSDQVLFTVKRNTYTNEIIFQKNVGYGQVVMILPEDTASLPYGTYVYDVQVTTAQGIVNTVITPNPFIVDREVTWNV